MEKKQNSRTNQLPAKVLATDSRKSNQDATGKQQTRSRRREFSSSFSQAQKSDRSTYNGNFNQHRQQQQQQQQQQQYHIFTPKSRGGARVGGSSGSGGNSNSGRSDTCSDGYARHASSSGTGLSHFEDDCNEAISNDFEIELNSVYLPGSKKQNLNHLLNFNYAPRDRTDASTYQRSGNNAKCAYVKRIKYNKEQFLQANCQFVVKSNGEYAPYTVSPDLLVEWSSIEQINLFGSSEEPQCPICLYHPVAAKMTRCGHVYCWPCILHYLALSDKKSWRKCPICYEAVHIGDLRSAISKPHRNYNCGEEVTFQLMCRSKNSLQAHTAEMAASKTKVIAQFPRLSDHPDELKHSKLVLAQPHEILTIIERERRELQCQLVSDGIDCPDSIFVQQALVLLDEREKAIRIQLGNDDNNSQLAEAMVDGLCEAIDKVELNADAKEFIPFDQKDENDLGDFIIDTDGDLTLNDIAIVPVNTASNENWFYFYQASDGQHLYLHSINVRMLQAMFGCLEHAPKSITGRIVQKESCSMTEELRKRLKYLQHLPVTCQFDVVEIELGCPVIISEEIRTKFKDELAQRQKNRQRRAREERKREKHIDRENERRIGKIIHTAINIDVTSVQQFPTCGSFDDNIFPPHSPPQTFINEAATSASQNGNASSNTGPSFAKMLTSPLAAANKSEIWPTLAVRKENPVFAQTESSPFRSNNGFVSDRERIASTGIEHSDEDSVDFAIDDLETTYARPEFNESFGLAIAEALNKAARYSKSPRKQQQQQQQQQHQQQQQVESLNGRSNGAGKKKKNTKKMILFSTGNRTFD